MNQALAENLYISPQEYLEGEPLAEIKHEYINGEVYTMAGASDAHVTVAGNAFASLKTHLRNSNCRTYISDMKVRIGEDNAFFYPDVMVCCEPSDLEEAQNYLKKSPKLIIEVLSPSTENKDRGEKFILYRQLASLEEYILIDPHKYYVEHYKRVENNQWILSSYDSTESELVFSSINFKCTLIDLYEDVIFR